MSFAKNLLGELLSKRLWPIALVLIAAIVAIPVLLGGGNAASGVGAGVAQAPAPTAPAPAASRASERAAAATPAELVGPPSVRSRPGAGRDPFRRPKVKLPPAAGTRKAPAPAPASASKSTGPAPAAPGTAPVRGPYAYRTAIRWSDGAAGRVKTRGISRLTPLGLVLDPALMYLGVSTDGTSAIFLLGPNATSTGEGRCALERCRVIAMKPGMSQVVDVTAPTGTTYQRHLDVVSVKRVDLDSQAAARKARGYVHPDGRDVVREMAKDEPTSKALGSLTYKPDLGVLTLARAAS